MVRFLGIVSANANVNANINANINANVNANAAFPYYLLQGSRHPTPSDDYELMSQTMNSCRKKHKPALRYTGPCPETRVSLGDMRYERKHSKQVKLPGSQR